MSYEKYGKALIIPGLRFFAMMEDIQSLRGCHSSMIEKTKRVRRPYKYSMGTQIVGVRERKLNKK